MFSARLPNVQNEASAMVEVAQEFGQVELGKRRDAFAKEHVVATVCPCCLRRFIGGPLMPLPSSKYLQAWLELLGGLPV